MKLMLRWTLRLVCHLRVHVLECAHMWSLEGPESMRGSGCEHVGAMDEVQSVQSVLFQLLIGSSILIPSCLLY